MKIDNFDVHPETIVVQGRSVLATTKTGSTAYLRSPNPLLWQSEPHSFEFEAHAVRCARDVSITYSLAACPPLI